MRSQETLQVKRRVTGASTFIGAASDKVASWLLHEPVFKGHLEKRRRMRLISLSAGLRDSDWGGALYTRQV
jgi:hypothetical protein